MYRRVTEWAVFECPNVLFVGMMVTHDAFPRVVLQQRLARCYADWEVGMAAGTRMGPEEGWRKEREEGQRGREVREKG